MNPWLRVLLSGFLLITLAARSYHSQLVERPNVLLIVLDDFRPVIRQGYGDENAITPNLDRLVQAGYHFENVFAQQALCAPSRNSMLTGRRPDTVRLYDFYSYWREFSGDFTTLPQYFKQQGYRTHSVGKIFHPGASSNFTDDYPLSWSTPTFHPRSDPYSNSPVCPDPADGGRLHRNLLCPVIPERQPFHTLPDIESTQEATRFLREPRNEPYFLAVGYRKPHIPFRIPVEYLNQHPQSKFQTVGSGQRPYGLPSVAWAPFLDVRNRDDFERLGVPFPYGRIPEDFQQRIRQHYYAAVTYVDDLIGQLLAEVKMDQTIIMVTSDHGWSLGEHGEWAKYSNYDVALRVPLVLVTPTLPAGNGMKIANVVELLDVFPTLVDLAGLPPVPACSKQRPHKAVTCVEGKSLASLLINATVGEDQEEQWVAYSQFPRPGIEPSVVPSSDEPKLRYIKIMGYSLRTARFRYTAWIQFNPDTFKRDWSILYGEEMYDHLIDEQENLNLADRPQLQLIKDSLRAILQAKFP
ncbi:iduronate 2-sulfatase [Anopheles aquasalis]|uniref:iduronate 2-sulfatase n=1 Tax=Anopheles aquasalis TaxID=42839 RepID=UPI00215A6E97|nr:iduronate 2-sulfatase [Anopheles aquasalis]